MILQDSQKNTGINKKYRTAGRNELTFQPARDTKT